MILEYSTCVVAFNAITVYACVKIITKPLASHCGPRVRAGGRTRAVTKGGGGGGGGAERGICSGRKSCVRGAKINAKIL